MTRLLETTTNRQGRAAGHEPAACSSQPAAVDGTHAPKLLTDLGFLLVPGSLLGRGAAYLLVALRPRPSRTHFDPERIEYWACVDGRADLTKLEWPMAPRRADYSWGTIEIIDRIAATNRFVSFGGALTATRDGVLHAALFRSDAPILALGGHSGPADPFAASIAGFFATLRAAASQDPRIAGEVAAASPVGLYAAFVWRALGNYQGQIAGDVVSPRLVSLLRSERSRLHAERSAEEAFGQDLAAQLRAVTFAAAR